MIRRLFRRVGVFGVAAWAWSHRGTVQRLADAAKRAPAKLRSDGTTDLVTELRAIARLDRRPALARRTDLRIGAVGDGGIVLTSPDGSALEQARIALAGLPGVLDVRAVDRDTRPAPAGASSDAPVPGSPGVVGEQPNRSDGGGDGEPVAAPLDEHPLGHSPMESDADVAAAEDDRAAERT